MIYLDNNATVPVYPEVAKLVGALLCKPCNPSSLHFVGREANTILENSRDLVKEVLNAEDYNVVFTSSGTESNNLVLKGLVGFTYIISEIEHKSVINAVPGSKALYIPVDLNGVVDLKALEILLLSVEGDKIVSVMFANNETGILQPIAEIVKLSHSYGAIVHSDIIQAFGKIEIDMKDIDIDIVTVSSHKLGGPQGASAVVYKKYLNFESQIEGGGQEYNLRSGTENIPAIAGFAEALKLIDRSIADMKVINEMRLNMEQQIINYAKNAVIFGINSLRLPNTTYIVMPYVSNRTQLVHYDLNGICIGLGSSCASGNDKYSHVLVAMGVAEELMKCVIRVSMGWMNSESDIEAFVSCWINLYDRLGEKCFCL